jgi:hypothetical protein
MKADQIKLIMVVFANPELINPQNKKKKYSKESAEDMDPYTNLIDKYFLT